MVPDRKYYVGFLNKSQKGIKNVRPTSNSYILIYGKWKLVKLFLSIALHVCLSKNSNTGKSIGYYWVDK